MKLSGTHHNFYKFVYILQVYFTSISEVWIVNNQFVVNIQSTVNLWEFCSLTGWSNLYKLLSPKTKFFICESCIWVKNSLSTNIWMYKTWKYEHLWATNNKEIWTVWTETLLSFYHQKKCQHIQIKILVQGYCISRTPLVHGMLKL